MLSLHRRTILAMSFLFGLAGLSSAHAGEPDKPRLDAQGEPLPVEAVQRLGSSSFRVGPYGWGAALSPDGKTIALLGYKKGILLLDSRTGKEIKHFNTPGNDSNHSMTYSPNGKTIALAGLEGVLLLDAESGKVQGKVEVILREYFRSAISFSADSQRIAVGDDYSTHGKLTATVWNADGSKNLHSLEVVHSRHAQVALSDDGKLLATWGENAHDRDISLIIQLWDTVTGKELKKIVVEGDGVSAVALSPNGKEMAVADDDSSITIWDLKTGKLVHRVPARRKSGWLLRYSPDGKVLVAGTTDGVVQVWETAGYRRLGVTEVGECTLMSVAFLPEKKVLVLALDECAIRVWEAPSGRSVSPMEGHTGQVTAVQFSPNGKKVLSAGTDGVRMWNAATGKSERRTLFPDFPDDRNINSRQHYMLSPDGRTVVTTNAQTKRRSRVMDLATEREQYGLDIRFDYIGENVAFSADGKMMAVVSTIPSPANGIGIQVWNLVSGQEVAALFATASYTHAVALSADGKSVLLASSGSVQGGAAQASEVTLWDVTTGKKRWSVPRDNQGTTHLAFSPAGDLIAAAGESGVHLFEATTGAELRQFENSDNMQINCLRFSPDGRMLAAGTGQTGETETGTVRLWETATAKQRVELSGHRGRVNALAFSPDGRVLASASDDTTVLLWDLTGKWNADVRAAAQLKPAEFNVLWNDLNDTDAAKSYRLVQHLAAYPEEAVALVKAKLPPAKAAPLDPAMMDKMIAQLDHDDFARREQASKYLAEVGKAAEPALTKALEAQPSPEKKKRLTELLAVLNPKGPTPEMVRPTRALEVLERLGTAEARQLLEELAKGDKNAKLTQEAKATLKGLGATTP
jgi:WD40 repeat protein